MNWLEIVLFGLIIFYIIYLNRELNLLKESKNISILLVDAIEEEIRNAKKKQN